MAAMGLTNIFGKTKEPMWTTKEERGMKKME